jgi:hypothetical protein
VPRSGDARKPDLAAQPLSLGIAPQPKEAAMKPVLLVVASIALALAMPAVAQDHLMCFKVRDPLLLSGTVDLDSPQFGAEPGPTSSAQGR